MAAASTAPSTPTPPHPRPPQVGAHLGPFICRHLHANQAFPDRHPSPTPGLALWLAVREWGMRESLAGLEGRGDHSGLSHVLSNTCLTSPASPSAVSSWD